MGNGDTIKKFKGQIEISGINIPVKNYILTTFSRVVQGLVQELGGVGDEGILKEITLEIDPKSGSDSLVYFELDKEEIFIKDYVQDMIWKTITGFLSTLKDIPDNLSEKPISITIEKL